MAEEAALDLLRRLAGDFNVRDAWKLYQIAKREFPDQPAVTVNRARDALRGDVARQVLASKPRSLGKSAAEGPNDRLHADLIDFSQNTRSAKKSGLVVTDVFTREAVTRALPNKNSPTWSRTRGTTWLPRTRATSSAPWRRTCPGGRCTRQKRPKDRNTTVPWWTEPSRPLRRTSQARWPVGAASGTTTWPTPRRPTTRGPTRPVHAAPGRGDTARHSVQGASGQRQKVPAQ